MFLQVSWLIYFLYSLNAVNACNERDLINKTVIVTGGARGIGYAIADNFLAEGAKLIIILDKNDTSGIKAADKLNSKYGCDKAVFHHCHVYYDSDYFDVLFTIYPEIDILVNNAGVMDIDHKMEMVHTNLAAVIISSYKFRERNRIDCNGRGGAIINISSRAGYGVLPFVEVYSALKHGVSAFTQNFGHDYNFRKTGIRVLGICPDFTHTELLKQKMVEDDQLETYNKFLAITVFQSPEDVARAVTEVFKTAETGTLWKVAQGKLSEAPLVEKITTEDMEKLEQS